MIDVGKGALEEGEGNLRTEALRQEVSRQGAHWSPLRQRDAGSGTGCPQGRVDVVDGCPEVYRS